LLAEKASAEAADAAVDLCKANPRNQEDTSLADAQEHAELAVRYDFMRKELEEMCLKEYVWRRHELQAVTATNNAPTE
jgi:hypothetical protein